MGIDESRNPVQSEAEDDKRMWQRIEGSTPEENTPACKRTLQGFHLTVMC
jgi:hypothetical protein